MVLNFQHFLRILHASYPNPRRSWTKSESSSETSYEYVTSDCYDGAKCAVAEKRCEQNARMETIPEEYEPKVSVKEILARFENLREDCKRDKNNNNMGGKNCKSRNGTGGPVVIEEHRKNHPAEKKEGRVFASTASVLELVGQVSLEQSSKGSDKDSTSSSACSSTTGDSAEKEVIIMSVCQYNYARIWWFKHHLSHNIFDQIWFWSKNKHIKIGPLRKHKNTNTNLLILFLF